MVTRCLIIILVCWLLAGSAATVRLGISPWTNEQLLHSWAEPYRKELTEKLGIQFILGSGKDHRNYLEKIIAGKFDVMQVPGHLALYLQRYHNFVPVLALNAHDTGAVVIRRKDFFENHTIHVPDPLSFISFILADKAKRHLPTLSVVHHRDQWQVLEGLITGKFGQGAVDQLLYQKMSNQVKGQLLEVEQITGFLPSMLVMPAGYDRDFAVGMYDALRGFTPAFAPLFDEIELLTEAQLQDYHANYSQYVQRVNQIMNAP